MRLLLEGATFGWFSKGRQKMSMPPAPAPAKPFICRNVAEHVSSLHSSSPAVSGFCSPCYITQKLADSLSIGSRRGILRYRQSSETPLYWKEVPQTSSKNRSPGFGTHKQPIGCLPHPPTPPRSCKGLLKLRQGRSQEEEAPHGASAKS